MSLQHKSLAEGQWDKMPLSEQLANIGSEVHRAIKWRRKDNEKLANSASVRALELLDLTLNSIKPFPRIKEITRLRETIVDYFYGTNTFVSSDILWKKYFDHFNYLARK